MRMGIPLVNRPMGPQAEMQNKRRLPQIALRRIGGIEFNHAPVRIPNRNSPIYAEHIARTMRIVGHGRLDCLARQKIRPGRLIND
jgi:hypothetical protein